MTCAARVVDEGRPAVLDEQGCNALNDVIVSVPSESAQRMGDDGESGLRWEGEGTEEVVGEDRARRELNRHDGSSEESSPSRPLLALTTMESSLWWLVVVMAGIGALFIAWMSTFPPAVPSLTVPVLSSCLGPPLLRMLREAVATQTRRDAQGRGRAGRSKGRGMGWETGRAGPEGFEMASLGDGDDD